MATVKRKSNGRITLTDDGLVSCNCCDPALACVVSPFSCGGNGTHLTTAEIANEFTLGGRFQIDISVSASASWKHYWFGPPDMFPDVFLTESVTIGGTLSSISLPVSTPCGGFINSSGVASSLLTYSGTSDIGGEEDEYSGSVPFFSYGGLVRLRAQRTPRQFCFSHNGNFSSDGGLLPAVAGGTNVPAIGTYTVNFNEGTYVTNFAISNPKHDTGFGTIYTSRTGSATQTITFLPGAP